MRLLPRGSGPSQKPAARLAADPMDRTSHGHPHHPNRGKIAGTIRHGCTSTTLNGHPQVLSGPPRWWDPPNSAWLGLLLILLLSPPIQAVECDCMKGSSTSHYFSSYTHMPNPSSHFCRPLLVSMFTGTPARTHPGICQPTFTSPVLSPAHIRLPLQRRPTVSRK